MKIVADEQIPYLDDLFAGRGQLIKKSSESLNAADVKDADLLLVRSVNKINQKLLENSSVKMVASATAGFDHVDQKWLQQNGIHFAYAPGCNAQAVAEYVACCIAKLIQMKSLQESTKIGLIGVGHVGSSVLKILQALNFSVLLNDPPRAQNEPDFPGKNLSEFQDLDLISVHTPLSLEGDFPTYHLLDAPFLSRMKKNAIILNAGRGEVIDEKAWLSLKNPQIASDVWTNEPQINDEFASRCIIATPHIAGYSLQAKYRATLQIYRAAQEFFSWPATPFFPLFERQKVQGSSWEEVLLQVFDPDQFRIKAGQFSQNRRAYVFRNEFAYCDVDTKNLKEKDQEILKKLFQKPE